MANDLTINEANHVKAFCNFIKNHPPMLEALKNKDWHEFARRYNGPGYRKNRYAENLATYYQFYSGSITKTIRLGSRGPSVKNMQSLLRKKGYPIVPDGIFGPRTRAAVIRFQEDSGLVSDGIVGPNTREKLNAD